MSVSVVSDVKDVEPCTKVEDGDFFRYLFLGERVSHIRAQLQLAEKNHAELSAALQRKYGMGPNDILDESGNIKRA